ncbi:MAG TPA: MarR family transcriptional regulator [Candidatus Limnocylindria bacterium]|nr:MarR family transcriptional regulator [Candidatus Limnocylindria bacterium]
MAGRRTRSSLLFDLFAANQRVRSLLTAAMEGSGLKPDEYAVYSALFEFEPISPTEIAAVVGMPPTTLSHYIRAMRERGHLDERRNPQDSRSRVLTLTVAGRSAHRRANQAFEQAYRRFMEGIGDQAAVRAALAEVEAAAADGLARLTNDARARTG